MTFQAAPGIAEIAMQYLWDNLPCVNVYHIDNETGDPWTFTSLGAYSVAFSDWENTTATHQRATNVQFTGFYARDLTVQGGGNREDPYSVVGSSVGTPLPNNCTISIKWGSGLAGRSNRGRTFHIGLTEQMTSDNVLTAAAETSLFNMYDALLTDVNAVGAAKLVILSRSLNGNPRAEGVGIPITQVSFADLYLDSQRRRLPGHNRHR